MKSFRNWYETARAHKAKRQPPLTSKVFIFAYPSAREFAHIVPTR